MARRTRVYGPYRDRERGDWRVIVVEDGGARVARRCASEEEAHRVIAEVEKELELEGPITVDEALEKYAQWLDLRGRRAGSRATTCQRLLALHSSAPAERRLAGLNATVCADAYRAFVVSRAVDTHRNALGEAKTFGAWCVKQGWLRRNPWAEVEPVGKRKRGKLQLRVDEARKWLAKASELAEAGDDGAVAAMCCLVLGLRASEVIERVGRDVDDEGALLWIDASKTPAGRRLVEVPGMLGALLHARARTVGSGAQLWPHDRHWVRDQVKRICRLAGVPVICAHGARGTQSSIAMGAGATAQLVAATLGHASSAVTLAHYAEPGAVASGQAGRALRVLAGGRAGEKSGKNSEGPEAATSEPSGKAS